MKTSISSIIDTIYPIGAIFLSANASIDPNILFIGMTWVKIEGSFLLGSNSTYSVGDTGGEATHTLIESELPAHTHSLSSHTHNYNDYYANDTTGSTTINFSNGYAYVHITDSAWCETGERYVGENWYANRCGKLNSGGNDSVYYNYGTSLGGSQAHTHTISHTYSTRTSEGPSNNTSGSVGSGVAHNNMPPYFVIDIWRRTA